MPGLTGVQIKAALIHRPNPAFSICEKWSRQPWIVTPLGPAPLPPSQTVKPNCINRPIGRLADLFDIAVGNGEIRRNGFPPVSSPFNESCSVGALTAARNDLAIARPCNSVFML